jgi:hypothetical protein
MAALCRCWGAPYSLDFSMSISRWLQRQASKQASKLEAIKHDGCPLHSQRNAWRYCTAVSDSSSHLSSAHTWRRRLRVTSSSFQLSRHCGFPNSTLSVQA